ncbi:guanine nucleotide exchange protein for ADP-robosylation factor, partial [Spiromyces aspiralis]
MPFSASCESFVPHHTPCLIDTAIPLSPLSSSFASTGFISEATATPTSDGMPQTPDAKCDAKLKTYFLQRLHNREKLASVLDSIFSLDANLDSSKDVSSSANSDNAATVRIASKASATKNSLLIRRETNVTLAPLHNRSPQLRSSTVSSSSSCDTLVPTARPYSHHTTHRPFSTSPAVPSSLRTPLTALDFVPSESSSPSPPVSGDCFSFGLSMFNIKPSVGIEQWQSDGLLPSPASPSDIARLLFSYSNVPSIDKRQLGLYLGSGEVLNREILREFTHLFDFAGMDFVPALRHYLRYFRMPGEAQAIDRFMLEFSKRYVETNPRALASPDAAYVLAYSVILLNTDLHSPMVKQRMTKQEF